MTVVEIYSKEECHLCERAKDKLKEIRVRHPFELREILLHNGHPRFDEFNELVPVIVINDKVAFHYRVPEKKFIELLRNGSEPAK